MKIIRYVEGSNGDLGYDVDGNLCLFVGEIKGKYIEIQKTGDVYFGEFIGPRESYAVEIEGHEKMGETQEEAKIKLIGQTLRN